MGKKIPDISHYHPVKDWGVVKNNVEFLISKATQGTNFVDGTLNSFIKGCESKAIPYWLYVYLNKGNEKAQAEYMVKTCKKKVGKYFVGYILDVEAGNTAANVKSALDYLNGLGVKTMVYTMYSQYSTYKNVVSGRGSNCAWWEARYGANNGSYSSKYPCHSGVDLHQYTSLGDCPGISGKADLNRLTGTKSESWFKTPLSGSEDNKTNKENGGDKKVNIIIGSARIGENGRIAGGRVGDQKQASSTHDKKGEVSMQAFYVHSKGWHILRPKDTTIANKIASNMKTACNNSYIGYDQGNRLGVIKYGVASKTKTECDCSSLVRECVKEASGIDPGNFTTDNEVSKLAATGLFESRISYTTGTKLYTGDILVTKTKGHTVIVVEGYPRTANTTVPETSGKWKYGGTFPALPPRGYYMLGDGYETLINYPTQIKRVQMLLNWAVNAKLTVDGEYGGRTAAAVEKFQRKYGLEADGKFGKDTLDKAKTVKK